jgi:hypothetical protein
VTRGGFACRDSFWTCGPDREHAELLQTEVNATSRWKAGGLSALCGSGPATNADLIRPPRRPGFSSVRFPTPSPEIYSTTQKAESRCDRIRDLARGLLLPNEQQLSRDRQARDLLQRVLSPAGYEEFCAQATAVSLIDKSRSGSCVTGAELREICRIHNAVFESARTAPSSFSRQRAYPRTGG